MKMMKEKLRMLQLHKYVGESSRSAYERGFEHLDDLARISEKSIMLRHMVETHEGENLGEVQFGMKIIQQSRSSFERQIGEVVKIQQEKIEHQLINSKAEFGKCSLPRPWGRRMSGARRRRSSSRKPSRRSGRGRSGRSGRRRILPE